MNSTGDSPGGATIPDTFWQVLKKFQQARPSSKPVQQMKAGTARTGGSVKKSTAVTTSGGSSGSGGSSKPRQTGSGQQYTNQTITTNTPGSDPYTQIDPYVAAFLKETGANLGNFKDNVYRNGPSTTTTTTRVPVSQSATASAPVQASANVPAQSPDITNPRHGTYTEPGAQSQPEVWTPPASQGPVNWATDNSYDQTRSDPSAPYATGMGYDTSYDPLRSNPANAYYPTATYGPGGLSVWDWLMGVGRGGPVGGGGSWGPVDGNGSW